VKLAKMEDRQQMLAVELPVYYGAPFVNKLFRFFNRFNLNIQHIDKYLEKNELFINTNTQGS
jgi:hypothetical protein